MKVMKTKAIIGRPTPKGWLRKPPVPELPLLSEKKDESFQFFLMASICSYELKKVQSKFKCEKVARCKLASVVRLFSW